MGNDFYMSLLVLSIGDDNGDDNDDENRLGIRVRQGGAGTCNWRDKGGLAVVVASWSFLPGSCCCLLSRRTG